MKYSQLRLTNETKIISYTLCVVFFFERRHVQQSLIKKSSLVFSFNEQKCKNMFFEVSCYFQTTNNLYIYVRLLFKVVFMLQLTEVCCQYFLRSKSHHKHWFRSTLIYILIYTYIFQGLSKIDFFCERFNHDEYLQSNGIKIQSLLKIVLTQCFDFL